MSERQIERTRRNHAALGVFIPPCDRLGHLWRPNPRWPDVLNCLRCPAVQVRPNQLTQTTETAWP